MERNVELAKKLDKWAYVLSGLVLILVGIMRRVKINLGIDFSFLPPVHALLNTGAAIFLILAILRIKNKNIEGHRKAVYGAMACSALFLLCYVLYHFTTVETKFCREGLMRTIYFIVLITHIILAGVSLPFILLAFIRGYCGLIEEHKKMTKWVFPIWLYVAVTGPLCYLMLYPCYQ
jgi:putative membrane protein